MWILAVHLVLSFTSSSTKRKLLSIVIASSGTCRITSAKHFFSEDEGVPFCHWKAINVQTTLSKKLERYAPSGYDGSIGWSQAARLSHNFWIEYKVAK
nr:hypothetical protein [Tanacetum cinerariifolium]